MVLRDVRLVLILSWVFAVPSVWAAPDTTLSITPVAVSGTTITASDENNRNSDIETAYNAHSHTDIAQLGNTANLGDGTAGNKTLCGNAADATDHCIRWDDTNNLWVMQQPSTDYNQMVVATGTATLGSGGLAYANGTAMIAFTAALTNGQLLIGDGSGAPTEATLTDGDNGIDITNGAGSITVAFDGDEVGAGSDPTLSSCGGSPAITGNDWVGRIVVGSSAGTGCVVTFNTAFTATPMVMLQDETSIVNFRVTPTASGFTIVADSDISGHFLSYHAFGLD